MSESFVLWFQDITPDSVNQVGKKGVSMAEMARTGLRVPPGFTLTTSAWETMMDKTGLKEKIGDYLKNYERKALANFGIAEKVGRHLLELFRTTTPPHEICITLRNGYDCLCEIAGVREVAVAIRSSGTVSRPGLFSSFLNVMGKEELEQRVMECWGSAYSPRAIAMRAQQGLSLEREPIGVVICQFIKTRTAGVLFTAHPITGNRNKMVIESSWGLGESVVQASVSPDRFTINRMTLAIEEKTINTKLSQVVPLKQGLGVEPVAADKQNLPSLNDNEIKDLVQKAKLVEDHFDGMAQDIEWAVSDSAAFPENIFLLQARPIVKVKNRERDIEKPEGKSNEDHIADLLIERLFR